MTLCITAAARYKEDPALVFLTDTRSQSSARGWDHAISLDDADKSRTIGSFSASIAGDPTLGDELLTLCEDAVNTFSAAPDGDDLDLHMNDLLKGLRLACRTRMKQMQDHLVGMTTPFKDVDEFLAKAVDMLPKDQYREVWHDLRTMNLGAEIILGGFHCGEPIILKIGLDGEPKWIDQIAVVGTGSAEALAFFAQNEYDEQEIEIQDCIMRVLRP